MPFADLRMPEEEEETWGEYPVSGVFYLFIWRELLGAFEFVVGLERSPSWGGRPSGASRAYDLGAWHGERSRLTEICSHLPAQVNQHLLTGGLGG